jgi:hypothetical protein
MKWQGIVNMARMHLTPKSRREGEVVDKPSEVQLLKNFHAQFRESVIRKNNYHGKCKLHFRLIN